MSAIRQANRDLRWAASSPLLCFSAPPHYGQWSRVTTPTLTESEQIAGYRHPPIGRYFERLITHWVGNSDGVTRLETNLVVLAGKRTVGEVDMLFEAGGKFYQWELALKFYLGTSDRGNSANWFGPLGRDRLDLKMDKLRNHQLRLLQNKPGQELLAQRNISEVSSYALVKGYLFHPFDQWLGGDFSAPPEVNADHGKGYWLHQCDLHKLASLADNWAILTKAEWLAPAESIQPTNTEEFQEKMALYFSTETRPLMVTALDNLGQETARGFIVPNEWSPSPAS